MSDTPNEKRCGQAETTRSSCKDQVSRGDTESRLGDKAQLHRRRVHFVQDLHLANVVGPCLLTNLTGTAVPLTIVWPIQSVPRTPAVLSSDACECHSSSPDIVNLWEWLFEDDDCHDVVPDE